MNQKIILLMLSLSFCLMLTAQKENPSASAQPDGIREEIQRYFGYEELFYRYVTLPYDINSNVNQQGKYVDVGFLLLAFLPLIFLFKLRKTRWLQLLVGIGLLLYLLLGFRYSFIQDINNARYNPGQGDPMLTLEASRLDGYILQHIYELNTWLINPLVNWVDSIPGFHANWSYPLMILFFLVSLISILKMPITSKAKVLVLVFAAFYFLWWLLSGGIIWYGFLFIPLGYLFIVYFIQHNMTNGGGILKGMAMLSIIVWLVMSSVLRVSNINSLNFALADEGDNLGKNIVEPRIHPYSVGLVGAEEALEFLAKNLTVALSAINSSNGKVYKAGTSMNFDIKNNVNRVLGDHTLSYFNNMVNRLQTRSAVTQELKNQGFEYVVLDLMIPTIDRTPEKTLTEKYVTFINFIRDNPGLRFIATDRLVRNTGPDGQKITEYGLVGEEYLSPGSYIVYEIL